LIEPGGGSTLNELMYEMLTFFDVTLPTPTPTNTPPPTNTPTITPTPTPIPPTDTPAPPTATVPPGTATYTAVPTDTPVPPTATVPTGVPTNTPLPPTNTPVPPTATVPTGVPTNTPLPPTNTPYPDPYISLDLNQTQYTGGDPFILDVTMYNPLAETTIDEYILLDIYGMSYFFWPSWSEDVDYRQETLLQGQEKTHNIFNFTWPENVGSADGLKFWAAMLDSTTKELYGEFDFVEWGYY